VSDENKLVDVDEPEKVVEKVTLEDFEGHKLEADRAADARPEGDVEEDDFEAHKLAVEKVTD
jgi:hypothetical protein